MNIKQMEQRIESPLEKAIGTAVVAGFGMLASLPVYLANTFDKPYNSAEESLYLLAGLVAGLAVPHLVRIDRERNKENKEESQERIDIYISLKRGS